MGAFSGEVVLLIGYWHRLRLPNSIHKSAKRKSEGRIHTRESFGRDGLGAVGGPFSTRASLRRQRRGTLRILVLKHFRIQAGLRWGALEQRKLSIQLDIG